jgi:transcriptional regulator with XRE-family HTH domain
MIDLEKFGTALRELRESRGITQEAAVERSGAYSDASGLRRIERGDQRPKRAVIVALVREGLLEDDPDQIDELLALAGCQALREAELVRLGLKRRTRLASPARATLTPPPPPYLLRAWTIMALTGAAASVPLALRQNWFVSLCCLLYASLYAISVLLETTYISRRTESTRAAVSAGLTILAVSLAANWVDSHFVGIGWSEGLWLALFIFVAGAIFQWLLIRAALPSEAVVPTRFRSHTGQAAHLKNSIYFLFIVVAFWLPPRHCVAALSAQGAGVILTATFCPRPWWLWIAFALMLLISIPMGSRLLDNLGPAPGHNRFVILFYTRALLYFLLSAICLIWYSAQPLP